MFFKTICLIILLYPCFLNAPSLGILWFNRSNVCRRLLAQSSFQMIVYSMSLRRTKLYTIKKKGKTTWGSICPLIYTGFLLQWAPALMIPERHKATVINNNLNTIHVYLVVMGILFLPFEQKYIKHLGFIL